MIEKELDDIRREQLDLDHVVMQNSGKISVRDPCDDLNLEKNTNLLRDEDNPVEPHLEESTLVKKKDRGMPKLTQSRMEINP